MNITVKTIAATTNEPIDDLYRFTKKQLLKLASSAIGKPVTVNFNQEEVVGEVVSAEVTNGKLVITANIKTDPSGLYLVPGFQYPAYKSITYGLVHNPQDKTLKKIA